MRNRSQTASTQQDMSLANKVALATLFLTVLALAVSVAELTVAVGVWSWPSVPSRGASAGPPREFGSIPTIASWIAAGSFAALVAYLVGYFWDTEVHGKQRSDHAQHFAIGFVFTLAWAPITLSIVVLGFRQSDPRLLLFWCSLMPTSFLALPAIIVVIIRYTRRVAAERWPASVQKRLEGFREDVEVFDLPKE